MLSATKLLKQDSLVVTSTYSLFLLYIKMRMMPTIMSTARIPRTMPTTTSDSCLSVDASVTTMKECYSTRRYSWPAPVVIGRKQVTWYDPWNLIGQYQGLPFLSAGQLFDRVRDPNLYNNRSIAVVRFQINRLIWRSPGMRAQQNPVTYSPSEGEGQRKALKSNQPVTSSSARNLRLVRLPSLVWRPEEGFW